MINRALYLFSILVALLPGIGMTADLDRPGETASLQGVVSSEAEGWMEGVLVSAKRPNGTVSVTVASNAQGRYRFPANRLGSGTHRVSIRAAGYQLASPVEVQVPRNGAAQRDLRLQQSGAQASQLMNAEWMVSLERAGYDAGQITKLNGCVGCHSLERVFTSRHDATAWEAVLARMETYGAGGQPLPYELSTHPNEKYSSRTEIDKGFARFLSSVNLNGRDTHSFELQAFPRPSGNATGVVITEYDIPMEGYQPHDVMVDPEGMLWAIDFIGPNLLRMDTATDEFTIFKMPILKEETPRGNNGLQMDQDGNLWWCGLKQGGLYRFDRETEEFTAWLLDTGDSIYAHSGIPGVSPDGTVWGKDQAIPQIQRLHPDTGEYTVYDPFPDDMSIVPASDPQPHGIGSLGGSPGLGPDYREMAGGRHSLYGPAMDSRGNYYAADIGAGYIQTINADSGAVTLYQTPTPRSGPRRMHMDSQDRLWFGEYRAGKVGMFNTRTKEFMEWPLRTPYAGPYDADIDKNGDIWSGGMQTDYLYRVDPETDDVTKYLLPTLNVNIRNMSGIDNRTTPVSVWIGENHRNKIARVEFLIESVDEPRVALDE